MASVVLGAVGQAFGGPVGRLLGSVVGSFIDNLLIGWLTPTQRIEGPRISDISVQTSTEGAVIPRLYGYSRLAGQVIWATNFLETKRTESSGGGGKGGGGEPATETTTYTYSISFAAALCEGEVARKGRIWANGALLDETKATIRFYTGSESQTADPLIEEVEGTGNSPAYRGVCYIVFEDLQLADYGNQIPTIQVEIVRALGAEEAGSLEAELKGVTLIPGAGEFAYATSIIKANDGRGGTSPQNQNTASQEADLISALDDLEAVLPAVETVSIVAGWFGSDLRVGSCTLKPAVETSNKTTSPHAWQVSGVSRGSAQLVSTHDGGPAYGGTPSDRSVHELITELKARGKRVVFYPFVFMDVAAGNTLPNPYDTRVDGQPAYPWRGRITSFPAPSRNMLRYSQDLSNAAWTKGGAVTITNDANVAPDGTTTADLVSSTASGQGVLQAVTCPVGTVFTVSAYFKTAPSAAATSVLFRDAGGASGHHIAVNPVTGAVSGASNVTASGSTSIGDGWYRVWMTFTTEGAQTSIQLNPRLNGAPSPALGWLMWGLQVERGASLTDYQPTTVAQVDKTATAATQVSAFVGSCAAGDFGAWNGNSIPYSGPAEWTFRRMILHYAKLCDEAGGVDAFLIGSEMVGLTQLRSSASAYPFVTALKTLAADVASILDPATEIGYAADWSEWNCHRPGDGTGDVYFNLDPLWSDANIDFIGIDNYMKLSDWRDGTAHLDFDAANGPWRLHDADYLASNVAAGEDYDWYYASDAARDSQTRTTIADTAYAKPWVFRQKDIRNWWLNAHYNRPDGVESGSPTGWTAQAKPIWFTELGCPAVDKASNQPNVFYDPKSSESFFPYYSSGERDDLIQRLFLEAHLNHWSVLANNPVSSVYGASMVDTDNIYAWTWDARPYPYFPAYDDVWADAANHQFGHWLNGRAGAAPLDLLVAAICDYHGFSSYDVSDLKGVVTGYVLNAVMTARAAIEPLMAAIGFDGVESDGVLKFTMRGRPSATALATDDLVMADGGESYGFDRARAAEQSLPVAFRVTYVEATAEYRQASVEAQRFPGSSERLIEATLPVVLDQGQAIAIGDRLIQQAWLERETAKFTLKPSLIGLDPGDHVDLTVNGRTDRYRLSAAGYAGTISAEGRATDPGLYEPFRGPSRARQFVQKIAQPGQVLMVFADLPILRSDANEWAPYVAAYATPWPGTVALYRSAMESNWKLDRSIVARASLGATTTSLSAGPQSVWDMANTVTVEMIEGTLASAAEIDVLNGANAIAIQNADGGWEVLQFVTATLTAPQTWQLSQLLRGQLGSEGEMRSPVAAGARVILLDSNLTQPGFPRSQYALPFYYRYGPAAKPLASDDYVTEQKQFEGVGLRCYSPVHLKATKDYATGTVTFSWIRRDRVGGDNWDAVEIPMSEDALSFEVDIYNGLSVIRTLTASDVSVTYSAAQQTTDFGAPPSSFTIAAYQISATTGRGTGRSATLNV